MTEIKGIVFAPLDNVQLLKCIFCSTYLRTSQVAATFHTERTETAEDRARNGKAQRLRKCDQQMIRSAS